MGTMATARLLIRNMLRMASTTTIMGVSLTGMRTDQRLDTFLQYRPLLLSIAYRMLGSMSDAEDMLQESFLRWQQSSEVDIRCPRAFLVTVITRLCINQLQSARMQREQYFGEWLPEPVVSTPESDPSMLPQMDESLSIAFLVILERLAPVQRAVFLLREVFDYEYLEIARIVSQTEVNCRQIFRRARLHIKEIRPRFDASTAQKEKLVREFMAATARGDIEGLLQLFAQDIAIHTDGGGKASATVNPVYGTLNASRLVVYGNKKFRSEAAVVKFAMVNGQPGIVTYLHGRAETVLALDILDEQIRKVYILRNPDKLQVVPHSG
jgi:RNA polymerase sigma-70 factor, ECF subfamily